MVVALVMPVSSWAQRGAGELRLRVVDEEGLAAQADGTLEGAATGVRRSFTTDERGTYTADNLPFGLYHLQITRSGFALFSTSIEVRSEVPISYVATLRVAPQQAVVTVTSGPGTLLDPFRAGSVSFLGADFLRDRPSAAPGRSIVDLVNTQPGWVLEANGILHPRGSEYQVQYVVDGIPLRDNRSPAFAQSLGVEEFESLTVRTAGYPAEFGGKLGGVIEVNTARDLRQGFHGSGDVQAGSFSALSGFFFGQYAKGRTSGGVSLEGMRTDRYLDPPVEANYTNDAAGRGVTAHFDRAWSDADRTRAYVQRRAVDFSVPNEALQQTAGQRQSRATHETLAQLTHQHVFSPATLGSIRFMARENGTTLTSNAFSTPIQPAQDRSLREIYVNADLAMHRGRHEVKVGGEATVGTVEESFAATITAYQVEGVRVFDRALPATFKFSGRRADREQSLFAQDVMRLGAWTVSTGLRYDHYQLMVDEHALSPRLAVSWYAPRAGIVVRGSYDRAFQTPSIENVILSSSDLVRMLGGEGQSLTLRSSDGHFSEAGVSKAFFDRVRLDASYYYRTSTNLADDDLLLNTAISFPIAFSRGRVHGFEAKLDVPHWGRGSGSVSYSRSMGVGELPIAGGLFLGDEVAALLNGTETFPISQDQRHTTRGRMRAQVARRVWIAGGAQYNSGLPTEIDPSTDPAFLVRQYGREVVDRVDFESGRVRPSWTADASLGWEILNRDHRSLRLQADVFNVFDRLNVINFAGILSGTAVAPRRTWAVRAQVGF
jgi:hypothetical protein